MGNVFPPPYALPPGLTSRCLRGGILLHPRTTVPLENNQGTALVWATKLQNHRHAAPACGMELALVAQELGALELQYFKKGLWVLALLVALRAKLQHAHKRLMVREDHRKPRGKQEGATLSCGYEAGK